MDAGALSKVCAIVRVRNKSSCSTSVSKSSTPHLPTTNPRSKISGRERNADTKTHRIEPEELSLTQPHVS